MSQIFLKLNIDAVLIFEVAPSNGVAGGNIAECFQLNAFDFQRIVSFSETSAETELIERTD